MDSSNVNLRPKDAAVYLGFAESTLAKMRVRGDGPPFSKLGPRIVAYNIKDLDDWAQSSRRMSTSENKNEV